MHKFAPVPGFQWLFALQCVGLHAHLWQGEYHAAVIELGASGIDDKHLTQLFGKYLVGMADDQYIIVRIV